MGLYNVKKYNFKSCGCDETAWFDIALAIKEYIQNTQGQILKALEVRKWRDWERLDLSQNSAENFEKRKRTKARLVNSDPCIFAGDQGKAIARSKLCQPHYVLEATIPLDENRGDPRDHDLRAVIILWGFQNGPSISDGFKALTVYNNYLDVEAKFSHFVDDGSSTSKESKWAVGLKGKGFILSTSYLAQVCEEFKEDRSDGARSEGRTIHDVCKTLMGMSSKPIGVGFNVGSRFCKGEYNKASPRMLKVKKEDLRALSATDFRRENPKGKRKDLESDDETDSEAESNSWGQPTFEVKNEEFYLDKVRRTFKKREELHLAEKSKQPKQIPTTHPSQERPLVRDDDVCIHVIGLPGSLTAEKAFSAIFGIIEERKVWKVPGTLFEIFEGKDRFYHRDQLVPIKSPVEGLSINYHGELRLSSDRMEIIRHGPDFLKYSAKLRDALDKAVSTNPELAILIMKSMLKGRNVEFSLNPLSKRYATEYKVAFEAACGKQNQTVYPYARRAMEEDLIRELGFSPWPLDDWQMQILEDAGAYLSIKEHAQNCLSEAEEVPNADLPGLDCLNRCVRRLVPELEHDVSIRQYHHSTPRALYRDGRFLLAQPRPCRKCTEIKCSCWVGPALVRIMQDFDEQADLDAVFWEYNRERKIADEHERIVTQSQAQNAVFKGEPDDIQAGTNGTETGGRLGLAAICATEDDNSSDEAGNGSQAPRASKVWSKTRTTRISDNPIIPQSGTSTPTRSIRRSYATRGRSGASTENTLDVAPRTATNSTQASSKANVEFIKTTEALENLLPAMNNVVNASKAGDFATVHDQLTKHLTYYANVIELAHRAQLTTSRSGAQQHDGLLDSAQNRKRKRTS